MTVVNGVTFPVEPWIPDQLVLSEVGNTILLVCDAALTRYGYNTRYDRQFLGHGNEVVIEPSKANQLTVVLTELYLGVAGQKQFKPWDGAQGKYAFQTADYEIQIMNPWPKRQGTQAIKTSDIAARLPELWRDSYVVWSAMVALALGGVIPPAGALRQIQSKRNGIMVGPMSPKGAAGGEAGFAITVSVQL